MKTHPLQSSIPLALLLGLAGCSSPPTGQLIVADDDDSVGDDDDSVGDDDDSVGDDDDSVGDDDDVASSPWEGDWFGELSLSRPGKGGGGGGGGGFTLCESEVAFAVDSAGALTGQGECFFGWGGGGGGGQIDLSGVLTDDGELRDGNAHMDFGNFLDDDYGASGGIFDEQGTRYVYMTWEATFEGGDGGGFTVVGEAWGVRY